MKHEKKLLIIISIVLIAIYTVLSMLGNKERVGYISGFNLNKTYPTDNLYDYSARLMYYNKVFKNSDIYGVYPKTNNFPKFIKLVKWDNSGSPFVSFTSKKELSPDEKIDNVYYTLKVKTEIIIFILVLISINLLLLFRGVLYTISTNIKLLSIKQNKKILISLVALIFFLVTFCSEIRLYNTETSRIMQYQVDNPNYYIQTSVLLHPYFLTNTNFYGKYRYDIYPILGYRLPIKDIATFDQFTDNHILGNIYGALKTGKTLQELKSHNFVSHLGLILASNQNYATIDDFNKPTLYTSSPNLITKIIYNSIPKDLRYIDSDEKEQKAASSIDFIKKIFIFIHILLWSLLVYVVGTRFSILYSLAIAIFFFCFPGSSVIMPSFYKGIVIEPLFPLYIFAFYYNNHLLKINTKAILFWTGLIILIILQWFLIHWISLYFQLPIILFSICLCNFNYQLNEKVDNIKEIFNCILSHIKKYTLEYITITIIISIATLFSLYISYTEMIKLQPENKNNIYYSVWKRPSEGTTKVSFWLVKDWDNISKENFVNFSFENRIKHNKSAIDYYVSYPAVYPMWRLFQFIPNSPNFINKLYLSLKFLLLYFLAMNVYIFLFLKNYRYKLILPNLFVFGIFVWALIFFNMDARFTSHTNLAPHILLQYITPIFMCAIVYLLKIIISDTTIANIDSYDLKP